jgi:ferrous iron transport protein B
VVKRVLLIGQPNVGKSSILKAITGANVQISNYPGTTVEVSISRCQIDGELYEFIDTPGIYNLYPSSLEEIVTEKAILAEDYDFAIVVLDATAIERGLVFLLSVIELGVPVIVALNFWEESERRGVKININALSRELGVPIVKVNPIKKGGVSNLIKILDSARVSNFKIRYDDHIEHAINASMKCLVGYHGKLSKRGLAVRLVEGDPLIKSKFECEHSKLARVELIEENHDPYNDIEVARAGYAIQLTRRYVKFSVTGRGTLNKLDDILLRHETLGSLAGILTLAGIIFITVILGNWIVDIIDGLIGDYVEETSNRLEVKGLFGLATAKSIQALYAQYAAALPYVFVFYFILMILEDTGFLVRLMLWLYTVSKRIGIHPKGIIPALLGLGCSVPATTATRILPSIRQRLVVASMLAFIPCSSRATIVFGITGRISGALAALSIYALGFTIAAIIAKLLSKILRAEEDAILIEDVPPLRKPVGSIVIQKAWQRLKEFILIVTPMIVIGAVLYAVLTYYSIDTYVINLFSPAMNLIHLPHQLSIPLVYGFLQKDLVISMVAAVMGSPNIQSVLTAKDAIIFTMASTYQVPCIIALGMMMKEFGVKRALAMLVILDAIGFAVVAFAANIIYYLF